MAMSKQDFIALADAVRTSSEPFTPAQLDTLASFCKRQNSAFMRERWVGYIQGENGPGGGSVKPSKR
jgi:hypothetical protein